MGMTDDDTKGLGNFITSLRGKPGRAPLIAAAMARWVKTSPVEAMNFCLTMPPADAAEALIAGMPAWTRADQPAALTWCMARYAEGTLPLKIVSAVPQIAYQWARGDLAGALSLIKGLELMAGGPSPRPLSLFRKGIGGLALLEDHREAALNGIRDFMAGTPGVEPQHWQHFLEPITNQDPAAVAEWLDRREAPSAVSMEVALRPLLANWLFMDPPAALNWTFGHGQRHLSESAAQSLWQQAAKTAPAAVDQWLSRQSGEMKARITAMETKSPKKQNR
jgi:hypothetical protein